MQHLYCLLATICLLQNVAPGDSAQEAPTAAKNTSQNYTEEAENDRVLGLPGHGKPDFGLFSGYITVDEEAERALFYAFAESKIDSEAHPLVLWLNGGPGCSSIAGGLFSELGPFYPTADGKLQENAFAWTAAANIIFLDSPAFVGWSYSNADSDIIVGDDRTAEDAYKFLQGFLARFPQYAGRPFWLAGESYAGHYVPNLALQVLEGNTKAEQDSFTPINFQGFLIGNPLTDLYYDNQGVVDFWYTHGLISDTTKNALLHTCNFSVTGSLTSVQDRDAAELILACLRAISNVRGSARLQRINAYDVYVDFCLVGPRPSAPPGSGEHDPCIDNEVATYLNREDVQQAMHANTTELPGPWQTCNPDIVYSVEDQVISMLPVYHQILDHDKQLKILIYSGDVDGVVPFTGTRSWIASLQLPGVTDWRPWYSLTGQVGGYVEEYEGLTFSTVRNAGHMVPYTQPERAYYLFSMDQWHRVVKLQSSFMTDAALCGVLVLAACTSCLQFAITDVSGITALYST